MSSKKLSQKIRKYYKHKNELQDLVRDTKQVLENVNIQKVFSYGSVDDEISSQELDKVLHFFDRDPTIVVFGQNNQSKAKLINNLLGSEVLPTTSDNWRWIKFEYGILNSVRISNTLHQDFEAWMENLQNSWTTIPEEELKILETDNQNLIAINALINHPILRELPILVSSDNEAVEVFENNSSGILPLFIYALDDRSLSKNNLTELCELKKAFPCSPICFVTSEFTVTEEIFADEFSFDGSSELGNCNKSDDILECLMNNLKCYVINATEYLKELHAEVVQKFAVSKHDLEMELDAMPKRSEFAIKMAREVRDSLLHLVDDKDKKITKLIKSIIAQIKLNAIETSGYWFQYSCMLFEEDQEHEWYKTMRTATLEVQNQVFSELCNRAAYYIALSVEKLHAKYFEPIYKCLLKLRPIDEKRNHEHAVSALSKLFLSACNIELTHSSFINTLMDSLNYFTTLLLPPAVPKLHGSWQKTLKIDFLTSLSPQSLVNNLRTNYHSKVNDAFIKFEMILKMMVSNMEETSERMECQRETLYALHAPGLAKLALQTISLGNMIRFGMPDSEGSQFGSVTVLKNWAGATVAVKTLCVIKEKHWRNVAMELYQKVNLDHDRIVSCKALMIHDLSDSSKILLATDQMKRNLHLSVRQRLPLLRRLQIALDVMEGIKHLHSLGLVHGNVQLKAIQLDDNDRAKLDIHVGSGARELKTATELPIHWAPEMKYASQSVHPAVDIYAFGFLLWFLCAGHAEIPKSFGQFSNVDEMWKGVKGGIRPERLKCFGDECWSIMERCWNTEPSERPEPRAILQDLESVRDKMKLGHFQRELRIANEFEQYEEVCLVQDFIRKSQEIHENYPKAILHKLSRLYRGCT